MHSPRLLFLGVVWLASGGLHAQDLAATCPVSSSYGVTLDASELVFDRASPAPFRVEMQQGVLRTDGAPVHLNAEDRDRLAVFEREARALAPRVRAVALHGVDVARQAVHADVAGMELSADTRETLEQHLNADADAFKRRIAASRSTHDWDDAAITQYTNQLAGDLLPLLVADLGQQGIQAALSGDLQTAASLRDRAASLADTLPRDVQRRMQVLRPQIAALCPSLHRLADLQRGVRDSQGRLLDLLQWGHE